MTVLPLFLLVLIPSVLAFDVLRAYSGNTFFNDAAGNPLWSWYDGWDNLTYGNVWYQTQQNATSQHLAYVNSAGRAVIRVDNVTNVPLGGNRSSVRITTLDAYSIDSVWIVDMAHVPYGCSLWPAFWSLGSQELWPELGEFDIFEAINMQTRNQMALHTTSGCVHDTSSNQTGTSLELDCSTPAGCVVAENSPNSYGSGFADAGGGVWATQFDVSGIYIWFWSRPNVPPSITQATTTSSIDISQWGPPSASYPAAGCNISEYFGSQHLVFDITLCGDWAGVPGIYSATCANTGPTGKCYEDNVVGPGSPRYDNAYFEVSRLITYTTSAPGASTTTVTRVAGPSSTSVPANKSSSAEAAVLRNEFGHLLVMIAAAILM